MGLCVFIAGSVMVEEVIFGEGERNALESLGLGVLAPENA